MPTIDDLVSFFNTQTTAVAYSPNAAEQIGLLFEQFENFSKKQKIAELFRSFFGVFSHVYQSKEVLPPSIDLSIIEPLHGLDKFIFYFLARGTTTVDALLKSLSSLPPEGDRDESFLQAYADLCAQKSQAFQLFKQRFLKAVSEHGISVKKQAGKIKLATLLPEELDVLYEQFLKDRSEADLVLDTSEVAYYLGIQVQSRQPTAEVMESFVLSYATFCRHVEELEQNRALASQAFQDWCDRPWFDSQQEFTRLKRELEQSWAVKKFLQDPKVQESYIRIFMALGCLNKGDVVEKFKEVFGEKFNPIVFDEIEEFWVKFDECCQCFKAEEFEQLKESFAKLEVELGRLWTENFGPMAGTLNLQMFTQYFYVHKFVIPRLNSSDCPTVKSFLEGLEQVSVKKKNIPAKESLADKPELMKVFFSEPDFLQPTLVLCFFMSHKAFLLPFLVRNGSGKKTGFDSNAQEMVPGGATIVGDPVVRKLGFDGETPEDAPGEVTAIENIIQEYDKPESPECLEAVYDYFIKKHSLGAYVSAARAIRDDQQCKQKIVLYLLENRTNFPIAFIQIIAKLDLKTTDDFCRKQRDQARARDAKRSLWSKIMSKKVAEVVDPLILNIEGGKLPSLADLEELLPNESINESHNQSLNASPIAGSGWGDETMNVSLSFYSEFFINTPDKATNRGETPSKLQPEDIERPLPDSVARVKKKLQSSPLSPNRRR